MISDLIVRITSSPENIDYLNKKFGSDFMNNIFNADSDQNYLLSIERSLDEKTNSKRTGFFSESYSKENLDLNNRSNSNKKIEEKVKNIKMKMKKKIDEKDEMINLKDLKESKHYLNNTVNNILPGKNYAKNILCKSVGKRNSVNMKTFEKNLRSYGGDNNNSSKMNKLYSKSSEKKHFKNYFSTKPKNFDDYMKETKKIEINKSSIRKPKYKNINYDHNYNYEFKDNLNEISFSNNNNKNDPQNSNFDFSNMNKVDKFKISNYSDEKNDENQDIEISPNDQNHNKHNEPKEEKYHDNLKGIKFEGNNNETRKGGYEFESERSDNKKEVKSDLNIKDYETVDE